MTLTVIVGASGSGKTTFLGDVHKLHKCCYIRQYHTLRPYVPVRKIPTFDPTKLPFWSLYSNRMLEGTKNKSYNPSVKIGGTMAGEFIAGLSGGQRKMLLFELVRQRTASSSDLLICLDEPFCGVTDDFLPYIVETLNEMCKKHNLLVVTNDHVDKLKGMADNIITVSAIDRENILLNSENFERTKALHAMSTGKDFVHTFDSGQFRFFLDIELFSSPQVVQTLIFTIFALGLVLAAFWDTQREAFPAALIAVQIVAFFCINPYLISLTDWRNTVREETQALMHSSLEINFALKSLLVLALLSLIMAISLGCLLLCSQGGNNMMEAGPLALYMFFDSASMTFPFICFGVYSRLPSQAVDIVSSLPFLLMLIFSTTFSPGAGVAGVKVLRYLFSRFYFWCALEGVRNMMEGCPGDDELLVYAALTGCLGLILFVLFKCALHLVSKVQAKRALMQTETMAADADVQKIRRMSTSTSLHVQDSPAVVAAVAQA
mmetsp:Transcript_22174/g.36670  ORF Transcript_22174/g.36670 Transcript_22174/m.36670 type:complete len:490 (-) Transcript_22174:166-1635(-)